MNEIKLLPKSTIDQIAAGEVIENPSCVVKELVENAIDAGARHIDIEIVNGGIDSITVSDDGSGIPAGQVRTAFLPHATSKLSDISELYSLNTMGFRGEALPSIAAVSRVTMITKTEDALSGVRIVFDGTEEISFDEVGADNGTEITVENLFFNTPARKKFLRTGQTEGGYVASVVEHLALCEPDIAFTFRRNGRLALSTSGNGNVRDVIYQVYGKDVAANLIDINRETEHLKITGVLGKPVITRSSRALENYFINGRYIRSNIVNKAIDDAYRPVMMLHQFPFTNIYLETVGMMTDVNVHPRKMELKFTEGNAVYGEINSVIKEALSGVDMIPVEQPDGDKQVENKQVENKPRYAPYERRKLEALVKELDETSPYKRIYDRIRPENNEAPQAIAQVAEEEQLTLSDVVTKASGYQVDFKEEVQKRSFVVIGQLFDTYWLVEAGDELFIIDQHAAHEKILFERNMKSFRERSFYSQRIIPPCILSLTLSEEAVLKENLDYFSSLGFEIEDFGDREISLSAVPDNVYGIPYEEFFRECLYLLAGEREKETEAVWHKIATASCKAAIKGNMKKTPEEAYNLIAELMGLSDPYHCPHGRPTIFAMTKNEIEKKFKRIV